jgi:poly(beta-D-mannuronate) C5 epimerase
MKLWSRARLAVACSLLLTACSSASSSPDTSSSGSSGSGAGDPGTGGQPSGDPPLPAPPSVPAKECAIDLATWKISNDGTHPDETTDGINAAIKSLVSEGCGHVKLPAGQYAIGKKESDSYTAGIVLPSGMSLEMDGAAVLQLRPTDTWAYCVIAVSRVHDVSISGGAIIGDRDVHDFKVQGEEGHCICVEDESERVAINHVKMSKAIGDGVLIVAQGAEGSSCKDISISNSELFDNRRQGVSIVGGMRVLLEKNEIHHIEGTPPSFGIDIESLKYKSQDITIRDTNFHHNHGGDFVNTDGRGVLFERNTMEDGEGSQYIDGPLIYWSNTDQTIRGNHIYMAKGSANGKMGILEYSHKTPRTNMTRTVVEGNTLENCSIDLMVDSLVTVRKNTIHGANAALILYQVTGVELFDNVLEKDGTSYSYMIHECMGTASGNILNGKPYDIAMTPDALFSNWDGQ